MDRAQDAYNDYQRGLSTDLAPEWRDLIKSDAVKPPADWAADSSPNLGSGKIPTERYTSHEFHREEVEKVWKRTWQMTCREEEIPNIGDHFVYNVAGLSFVVVRVAEDRFKAYWNVCLHRGRQLVDKSGEGASQFRCPYHAWTWNIDGDLAFYPGGWDFPDIEPSACNLREVLVDTWGGFVFINPDKKAGPLSDHVGGMQDHFARWPTDRRHSLYHVRKRIEANWKVSMEAFLEGYHVTCTHPQILAVQAEPAIQNDVYDEGKAFYSRLIDPCGVPSYYSPDTTALDAIKGMWATYAGLRNDELHELPEDIKDRTTLAQWRRRVLGEMTKADYSSLSDAEMLDGVQYWLFPNFLPWYGEGLPLVYLFRPDRDSPDSSYMDVWMLIRSPDEGPPPPAPKMIELEPHQRFEEVIGPMGKVFDQDDFNMPMVQVGMRSWPGDPEGLTLSRYQEIRVRFFHQVLMRVLKGA